MPPKKHLTLHVNGEIYLPKVEEEIIEEVKEEKDTTDWKLILQ